MIGYFPWIVILVIYLGETLQQLPLSRSEKQQ
jgi:hypothetical protein